MYSYCVFSLFFFESYKKIVNNDLQLKITKEGLWTKNFGFYSWNDFTNIDISLSGGRVSQMYLNFTLRNSTSNTFLISDLKDCNEIIWLIDFYYRNKSKDEILLSVEKQTKKLIFFSLSL